jgi:predicted transcriptional regulator
MTAYYEQPLRKLLGSLSQTIGWLIERGTVEVSTVPPEHMDAVKQLERIGIVHKRNNRIYELQKVRLKKLMDQMGMDSLSAIAPAPAKPVVVATAAAAEVAATATATVTTPDPVV